MGAHAVDNLLTLAGIVGGLWWLIRPRGGRRKGSRSRSRSRDH